MSSFQFEILYTSKKSGARVGRIHTPHGAIDTPNFVAVGTNGTLKALDNAIVDQIGLQLMFCNTYHLLLQPGTDVVKRAGGLHQFIQRKLPIITDSGGFQVFSLAYGGVADELKSRGQKKGGHLVLRIDEEGVLFRSYRDGALMQLTPESSIRAQQELGADIIIPFDELPPYHISQEKLKASVERTHRWQLRSLSTHLEHKNGQAIYAVIHGGCDYELRAESVEILAAQPFDGLAIGGSIGKTKEEMFGLLNFLMERLPKEKPCHLLGVGDIESIEFALKRGVDTFDSSYPTRAARHGQLLTHQGSLKIARREFRDNFLPIDPNCSCPTCKNYSLAYLHHLFKAKELTSLTLATIHNLHFMVEKMARYREEILNDHL